MEQGGGAALDMSASFRAKSGRPPQAGGAPLAYPPPSLERGVAGACLAGGAGEAAWHDKLALLLYLLMDADIADLEAFRCWPEMCGVCKGILCRRGPCLRRTPTFADLEAHWGRPVMAGIVQGIVQGFKFWKVSQGVKGLLTLRIWTPSWTDLGC